MKEALSSNAPARWTGTARSHGRQVRPVLCFTGNGDIWYRIAELERAVRSGIKRVIVVNNNYLLN